jgi:hypothetical protein
MTYLELCQLAFEEIDGRPGDLLSTVDLGRDGSDELYLSDQVMRQVVRQVAQTYLDLQESGSHLEFLRTEGEILDVVAGTAVYCLDIADVNHCSTYFQATGQTARYPLSSGDYDSYKYQQSIAAIPSGTPTCLINGPSDQWILWPTPVRDGKVYGEYWSEPVGFSAGDDEPVFGETHHKLIAWLVVRELAPSYETETAQAAARRAKTQVSALLNSFHRDYFKRP